MVIFELCRDNGKENGKKLLYYRDGCPISGISVSSDGCDLLSVHANEPVDTKP